MTLTPEDVANKQFSSVRLREGYDMEEVDQFLDEVEQELARLLRENDDLRGRLTAAERAVGDSERKVSEAERRAVEAERRAGDAERRAVEAERQAAEAAMEAPPMQAPEEAAPEPVVQPEPEPEPVVPAEPEPVAAAAAAPVPAEPAARPAEAAAGILALAQRTAEEHVAEARAEADRILGEARTRADEITREAEETRRSTIGALEREKTEIEGRIGELKTFEREYRSRLRSYLEGQLRELDEQSGGLGAPQAESSFGG